MVPATAALAPQVQGSSRTLTNVLDDSVDSVSVDVEPAKAALVSEEHGSSRQRAPINKECVSDYTVFTVKESNRKKLTQEEIKEQLGSGAVGVLPTFCAWAINPASLGPTGVIRILCDTGAQISLINQELAEKLKLRVTPVQELGITPLGAEKSCAVVGQAEIQLTSGYYEMCSPIITAYVMPKLIHGKIRSLPVHPFDLYPSIEKLNKPLAEKWPQPGGTAIDLILGQDHLWSCISGKVLVPEELKTPGVHFWDTPFGLILQGWVSWGGYVSPYDVDLCGNLKALTSLKIPKMVEVVEQEKEPKLEKLLKQLFQLEALGVKSEVDEKLTPNQAYAVKHLNDHLQFDKDKKRFVVHIPINPKSEPLVNNFRQARVRFESLRRTLAKDESKAEQYNVEMAKYIEEGHAEEISKEDLQCQQVFYLPHSGVFSMGSTGQRKCRVVFDCAAKDVTGSSLNSVLVAGPVPDADLLRILTAWRSRAHAANADVRSCFLTIKLHPSQQNLFRFLWTPDPNEEPRTYKFTSLIFGSSVSPWISSSCLFKVMDMWEDREPGLIRAMRRAIWVDDILLGMDTVAEGKEVIRKMEQVLATASFQLAKFVATSDEMLEDLKEEQKLFPDGRREAVKALGILWKPDDTLAIATDFDKVFKRSEGQETKRTLARAVASVYDPLQLLAPWRGGGNVLLKAVWDQQHEQAEQAKTSKTAKYLWDQLLDQEMQDKIKAWKCDHQKLAGISIPRCLHDPNGKVVQRELWGFSDASPSVFGAVVYMRTCYSDREPTSMFVMAKSKVNSKNHTLPRMELLGAVFLARLIASTKEYLEVKDIPVYCFSDSAIVLHWLSRDPGCWKLFIANQVQAALTHTKREQWYHVPGAVNPSDLLTRPMPVEEFVQCLPTWSTGPEFIRTGALPPQPDVLEQIKDQDLEKKENIEDLPVVSVAVALADVNGTIEKWTKDISDVGKLLKRVALVRRAAFRLLKRFLGNKVPERFSAEADRSGSLFADVEEKEAAYNELVRVIQRRSFEEELRRLTNGEPVKENSKLRDLEPFVDGKGLMRAKGRMAGEESEHLSYQWLYPLILPSDDDLLGNIILHIHQRNHHMGVDWIHAELRQRWWILKARATIRRYKNRCLICRRYDGTKLEPHISPIPRMRLDVKAPPFSYLAIDGMGPLQVKSETGENRKVWVLVCCCMVTRGINMEILSDLSTESFVTALRHQISRHGVPQLVRLDNLSSHVKMSRQIAALQQQAMEDGWRNGLKEEGIKFSFSRVGTPSTNGVVERCVKTAKMAVLKCLHKTSVTKDQLLLFLKESTRLINSRPLTQVHQGETDDCIAITPNHLIWGHKLDALPLAADVKKDARKSVNKLWEERQKLRHQFTTLFMDGYLSELRRVKRWSKNSENVKKGDLVVVAEPSARRVAWPIGVVEAVESNKDDSIVRTVRVRLAEKTVTRSVRSLIFLRHLPDYEPAEVKDGEMYGGDQTDPARDARMKFVTAK